MQKFLQDQRNYLTSCICGRHLGFSVKDNTRGARRSWVRMARGHSTHERRATECINLLNTLQEFLNECCAALHSCKIMARKTNSVTSQEGVNKQDLPDPDVWSPDGPVSFESVAPMNRIQSKSSFWSCLQPQGPLSKSQSNAVLGLAFVGVTG